MKIEAVIFDKDGVLIDSVYLHYEAWRDVLRKTFKIDISYDEFKNFIGFPSTGIASHVLLKNHLKADPILLKTEKEKYFYEMDKSNMKLFPGVKETVSYFYAKGFKLAVASSDPDISILQAVEDFGLKSYFQALVGNDDVPRPKPAPDLFVRASKLLGVDPGVCLVIEDTPTGIKGAKEAGMKVIGISNSYPKEALAEADKVIDKIEEVKDFVAA